MEANINATRLHKLQFALSLNFDLEIVVVNFTHSAALISPSTIFGFIQNHSSCQIVTDG